MRLFCAAVLLSLGFAHKPLQARPMPAPTEAAYVLPDGSVALLCAAGADHRDHPADRIRHGCDACLIASGALLPAPPADHSPAAGLLQPIRFPAGTELFASDPWRPGSPVRGPPVVFA